MPLALPVPFEIGVCWKLRTGKAALAHTMNLVSQSFFNRLLKRRRGKLLTPAVAEMDIMHV